MDKIGWTNTQPLVIGLVILTLVCCVVVGSVSAAEVTVGPLPSASIGYINLEDAVDASSDKGIITMMSGTYKGAKNRGITINKDITIQGAAYAKKGTGETIIDGENQGAIFTIENGAVVNIYGITFRNSGSIIDKTAAINNYGTLNIDKCKFTNNDLGVKDCGKLNLLNSEFTRNSVCVELDSERALIKGCDFANNGYAFEIMAGASSNVINYNRFAENSMDIISNGLFTNVEFNWWGSNAGVIKSFGIESIVKTVYFILQLDADNRVARTNQAVTYPGGELANLGYSLKTNTLVDFERNVLPSFNVFLTLPNGRTITLSSNTVYNYALTGFRNQNFVFRLRSDNEAFGFNVNFVGGITPSIQPAYGVFYNPEVFCDVNKYNYNPFSEDDDSARKVSSTESQSETGDADTEEKVSYKGNTNNVPDVQASMKETGIPIIGMILVILSVLGVFVKGKKD
ncbi:MAG: hypothetical protein FWE58_01160 [Methanobrevibacter sp.]|nr:hypothetical protein [Methanobrevibacter sp.]